MSVPGEESAQWLLIPEVASSIKINMTSSVDVTAIEVLSRSDCCGEYTCMIWPQLNYLSCMPFHLFYVFPESLRAH